MLNLCDEIPWNYLFKEKYFSSFFFFGWALERFSAHSLMAWFFWVWKIWKFHVNSLTSSNGHPLDRSTVWDWRINNFNSLSFISASCVGFVRIIVIFNVTLDVNSPRISLTDINVLSVILSSGSGFQFLIIIAPIAREREWEREKSVWVNQIKC